jgi:hypothetical protein
MRKNQERFLCLGISILAALTLSPALRGQASSDSKTALPLPTDWSHHHLIFSKPANAEQAQRVERDPRYWHQKTRQSPASLQDAPTGGALGPEVQPDLKPVPSGDVQGRSNKDWSQDLGSGATVGATNYPAKYTFQGTTATCAGGATQPDFVVYGTGVVGSATQASILAYDNLYSGCSKINLGTAANFAMLAASTITSTGATVVTGGNIGISPGTSLTGFPPGVLTSPAVEHLGDAVAAQAEADANTAYTSYQGLTGAMPIAPVLDGLTFTPGLYNATSTLILDAGQTLTLNGSGTYIFQVGSTLTVAGTVVLSGGAIAGNVIWLVGSSATINPSAVVVGDILALASITLDSGASVTGRAIALNGAVTMIDNAVTTVDTIPSVYWAYNTGGTVTTSPLISQDGTQITFVQVGDGYPSTLVLLKWAASSNQTVGSPMTLVRVPRGQYQSCVAPCMTTLPLRHSASTYAKDTNSSVFYDYANDTAYVGDDDGWLHKFTPFFKGEPTPIFTGGWPVQVNPGSPTALNSPVFDYGSGNVFVTDNGGFLYLVEPTPGVIQSGQLDFSAANDGGPGLVEGPIVDSTAGLVYVFAASDGSGSGPGGADDTAVYQLASTFTAGDTGLEARVGDSTVEPATPSPLYIGAFDSAYENSVNATGDLYVCGNTGGPPILYQVSIGAGVLGTVNAGPVLSTSIPPTPCSPVTDILNPNASGGPTEWMFASVQTDGASSACASGGCIFNFKDTPWLPSKAYAVGQEIVDSNFHTEFVSTPGTSGASAPFWGITQGGLTTDHTVKWLDLGPPSAFPLAVWRKAQHYSVGAEILDGNNNIEITTTAGTTGTPNPPVWNLTVGGTTHDGTVTWTNVGPPPTAALAADGGTSGIIIDNIVGSGTLAGASQVYFSTLSGGCGTGGTDGCAVQASQSALQ